MLELSDFLAFLLGLVVGALLGVVATIWWAVHGWSGD